MKNYLPYILGALVFFASCEKELPNSGSTSAVFFLKGEISGEKIDIRAGDNSYYMFPGVSNDSIGIRSFNGVLGKFNCQNLEACPNTFLIAIREMEVGATGRPSIEQNIQVRAYDFRGPPEFFFTSYKATFISKSTPVGANHYWEFGDGTNSLEINPVHFYLNEKDSIVEPSLYVSSSNGCDNTISYETRFLSPCDVDFFPKYKNGYLSWSSTPNSGRNELWDLSNGYLPLGPNNLPPLDSVFTACVKSVDTVTGCTSYKCKNIIIDTSAVGCVANYDVVKETVVGKDVRDYSEITITWIDEAGKVFTNELHNQPSDSYFEILNVEDYVIDQDGNQTKKIEAKFKVRLFGASEVDFIDFTIEEAAFAISYL